MTENERAVMSAAYRYLDEYSKPPVKGSPGYGAYWEKACERMSEIALEHKNHPLALKVLAGIYSYLDEKSKAIDRKAGIA